METQILLRSMIEEYKQTYERGKHFVGISMWHFEWCTKYRYKMFGKFEYQKILAFYLHLMVLVCSIKSILLPRKNEIFSE